MFGKPEMPPPKMAVMIGIGKEKQKGANGNGKPGMFGGKEKVASSQHDDDEPDADQMGGPSDNDADNRVSENLDLIQKHIPEAIHPIAGLIEAIANYCRGQQGEERGEGEAGY